MNLIKLLSLGILLFSFFACSSEENTNQTPASANTENHAHNHSHDDVAVSLNDVPYKKNGVEFTIPKGWKIIETPIMEVGTLLMVEKDGEDESGQFMVSILKGDEVPLGSYMQSMQEEILKSLKMQGLEGSFTEIRSEKYNGVDVLVCEYEHNSGGLDFSGSLKTFYCGGRTMYIFTQSEEEDFSKNKKDIQLLEETFSCS